jgi:uncharacterized protein (DUF433 family)
MISTSPEVMSGTPVFAGTRVPIATLFDYLKTGDSADDFLADFPTVKRDAVVGLLEDLSDGGHCPPSTPDAIPGYRRDYTLGGLFFLPWQRFSVAYEEGDVLGRLGMWGG